ncbi:MULTISPECIES: IclR family transcriptional regulator [Nocardiaceae]|uniref:DNA-binding IclR family transcriptional regulator n=1 Tax=Rhodococcoides corynebacterioides TaxID=53972 RepID=A0ABS2KVS2_9NOCA|nr:MULTISPECIES: IclR family transcriptional regulator [Rhodococcus]MBM7415911.1 DNA-binding IclR family transcriptional regulator [Rhodococcus corynebacterioides]MBP1118373.1 DNA-binding IclR family transcriptional regulator [Rhodococcus sp. PvP016]
MAATTSSTGTDSASTGTESADRVADVLLSFAQSDRALGVTELARRLDLSKAVVHRILQSLASRSIVQPVAGESTYSLGPAAIGLGTKAWSQLDVRSIAAPILRRLRAQTLETATLSVLVGHRRVYLDQYESPQEVKMVVEIGPQYPLHSGASSRAILAFLPPHYAHEAFEELRGSTPDADETTFLARLQEIRDTGYGTSINERNTGAASIAAPFFDAAGHVLGSVSSSGPAFRYSATADDDHVAHAGQVLAAARAITQSLEARAAR